MGKKAKNFQEKCLISENISVFSSHPSPLSAEKGFFNSKVFSKINKKLKFQNKEEIN
jgi:uracil-DNA glycosylase